MRISWWRSKNADAGYAGDLESRLTDLREAMFQASYSRSDPARQREFLERLFEGSRSRDSFVSVVESRDYPDETAEAARAPVSNRGMSWPKRRGMVGAVAAAVILLVVGVCYGVVHLSRSGGSNEAAGQSATLRVGLLNVVDTAPFYRAFDRGYFKDEHINIEIEKFRGGPDAISELVARKIDIAFTSYPGALTAQASGAVDLKIAAAAYTARNSHLMLMGLPDGPLTHAREAPGKRIAVTATGSISDIGTMLALRDADVDPGTISWVSLSMDDMLGALRRGEVDGAVMAEPYVTQAEEAGAVPVLDVTLGRTALLPLSGWFVTAEQVKSQGEVIRGFQRALARGVSDVQKRDIRDLVLTKYLNVTPAQVDDVRIGTYPEVVDPVEIKKVADLMSLNGFLHTPVDVRKMVIHWPSTD
ncbi:ABC transporter substrate-binding protein [Amycolatopsis sp. cmx-8-4]|uniref:ABC transporter substrate-binding protein n=1 Tax=Amycolatopsis sp. cmx-8-4 TaxID=2790947 RepID=UPI00397E2D07